MAAEKKITTVTLKDLAAELVDTHGLPKGQMNSLLTDVITSLGKAFEEG